MLRLIFIGVILASGLTASIWSRFAALLTYVWFALFRPQEWTWIPLGSLRLSLITGIMLVIPSLLTGIFPNISHPLSIGTVLFFLLGLLAQGTAVNPDVGWYWIDILARLFLVALLAVTILDTPRRVLLFLAVLAGSVGFHTAKAGVAYALGGGLFFAEGFAGAFSDNNGYALVTAMMLPLLFCVWQNAAPDVFFEKWIGRGFLVAVPLSMGLIVGTKSRAGFLAAATAIIVTIILHRRRFALAGTVILTTLVVAPFVPVPEGYFERIETIRTYEEVGESSALSRLHFWRVAVRMAENYPLGVGLMSYESAYDDYDFLGGEFGRRRSVHSSHFQVIAELGFLGFLLWVSLFAYSFWVLLRVRRFGNRIRQRDGPASHFYTTVANGLIASQATFLVGGAFVASALNDVTWYTFAVIAAVDRLARARAEELDRERSEGERRHDFELGRATA